MNEKIKIFDLNTEKHNIFEATCEELIAVALDEADLLKPTTTINDMLARDLCRSFENKKINFKESTKLGNMLVKHGIITHAQLQESIDYQKKNPSTKIGSILIKFKFCNVEDIENFLITQVQIRQDVRELEDFMQKIDNIKRRLENS